MRCSRCLNQMSCGAPHCETIKVQYECECGHIETELYTPEELKVNQLTAATGASLKECRQILEENDYNLPRAERFLEKRRNTVFI